MVYLVALLTVTWKISNYHTFLVIPDSSVAQVQATDADNGVNAVVEYFIQKGAYDDFTIDNSTGTVSVSSKLDFDRRNTYNIEITAVDHGVPSLTGTTTLTVNIINTNDKIPYFVPTTQTAEVSRNNSPVNLSIWFPNHGLMVCFLIFLKQL